MQDINFSNEKIFGDIKSFSFDNENDYYTADCKLQTIQESIILSFEKIRESEKSVLLQAGYRIVLQMLENFRNFIQYQLNLRFGKCYYLMDRLNIDEFFQTCLDKEAMNRMNMDDIKKLNIFQKMSFFTLSTVMLQIRAFYVDFVERMLNTKISTEMAETFVDKCAMTPCFEDSNGVTHQSFDDYLKTNGIERKKRVVEINSTKEKDGS